MNHAQLKAAIRYISSPPEPSRRVSHNTHAHHSCSAPMTRSQFSDSPYSGYDDILDLSRFSSFESPDLIPPHVAQQRAVTARKMYKPAYVELTRVDAAKAKVSKAAKKVKGALLVQGNKHKSKEQRCIEQYDLVKPVVRSDSLDFGCCGLSGSNSLVSIINSGSTRKSNLKPDSAQDQGIARFDFSRSSGNRHSVIIALYVPGYIRKNGTMPSPSPSLAPSTPSTVSSSVDSDGRSYFTSTWSESPSSPAGSSVTSVSSAGSSC